MVEQTIKKSVGPITPHIAKITATAIEEEVMEVIASEPHTPSGMISVSSLIYPCIRKAYYDKQFGQFFDKQTLITFWVGKKVHESQLLSEFEMELKHDGIVGRIDDYDEKRGILIDKKTCDAFPLAKYGVSSHYITQLEYYKWLLEKNGHPVNHLFILYIKVSKPKGIKAVQVHPRSIERIEKEIMERKAILELALKTKVPPARKTSWLCNYCAMASRCYNTNLIK